MSEYKDIEGDEKVAFAAPGIGVRPQKRTILSIVVLVAIFIIGIIIGVASRPGCADKGVCLGKNVPSNIISEGDLSIEQKIIENVNPDNIKSFLKKWTAYPHLAGTSGSLKLAKDLQNTWQLQGLDSVQEATYEVLLSYPNFSDPNYFQIVENSGAVLFESQKAEKPLDSGVSQENIVPPFNSYSAPGTVQGDVVFANLGKIEDFQLLKENYSIDPTGKICIVKYGKLFRANKAKNAEKFGCIGLLMYTDPQDYSNGDVDQSKAYPYSWWMPKTGVQRGTAMLRNGDPLTPFYPSTSDSYRLSEDQVDLPKIPVQPISYGNAEEILRRMTGPAAPSSWVGALPIAYKLGPGFVNANFNVKLHVTTRNKRANITTAVGVIYGSTEPDRYVIVGNHRDAWVFGAADPTSGTAVMAEMSRVYGDLLKKGWRPKRSIMFCSWAAEEYGLVGSYEWIQDFVKNIAGRAVAYLNVDIAVEGDYTFGVSSVPLLHDVIYDAAKQVKWPTNPSTSVYDDWMAKTPNTNHKHPRIDLPGGGSDHEGFISLAGVPVADFRITFNKAKLGLSSYPMYHSAYETFRYQSTFLDKDFKFSGTLCQIWSLITRSLADTLVLPLNPSTYASEMTAYVNRLNQEYGTFMLQKGITLDNLKKETMLFSKAASDFQQEVLTSEKNKHVIFAPSSVDQYSGDAFPGLRDLLYTLKHLNNTDTNWDQTKRHLAAIEFALRSAVSTLLPVTNFVRS